jgi:hypothetical protein
MIATSFDFTVTSTRVVGFTVPLQIQPGSNCQFNVTISHDGVVLGLLWFVKVVPANRVITFTVGTNIPLGTHHFTVLITVLSAAAVAPTSGLAAPAAKEYSADEPAKGLDVSTPEHANRTGAMPAADDVAHST